MRRYNKSIFIVTSRPKAYQYQPPANRLELTQLWVRKFQAPQRQQFVERWYHCQERYAQGGRNTPDVAQVAQQAATDLLAQIEAQPELKDLAKNPLLLTMIVRFHRRYPRAKLPEQRVKLYQEICQLQLQDRPGARELETVLTQCEAQTILQRLALGMLQQHEERLELAALLKRLTAYLEEEGETIDPQLFLDQVVQISELLIEQEDEIEFAHLSFQEYLAARHIADQPQNRESILYEHFGEDWWKQTILLYAAQTNPSKLIRTALQQDFSDLAYACLQENSKRVEPTLSEELKAVKQAVVDSRYRQLETYLQNGQWQEADNETYRLMITTVGKEEGQWFDPEELLNFPCEELRAIDGLWVKYSQGRFGFSVQKELYLDCGGIPDGKYYKEAWDKFCHECGWKKAESYVSTTYSLEAPRGHLPRPGGGGVGGCWVDFVGGFVCILLSRQDL